MSNKLRICEKLDLLVRVNRHIISEIPDILNLSKINLEGTSMRHFMIRKAQADDLPKMQKEK